MVILPSSFATIEILLSADEAD
jgi:hypothetical protein